MVIIPIEEFTSVYKVYLKNLLPSNPLIIDLSFFGIPKSNPTILDFQTFLSQFNELSRKKICVSLNNIQEISYLGTASKEQFSHCYALIFTIKENNQHRGYFIGFLKEKGYFLLGIWPIGVIDEVWSQIRQLPKQLNDLIANPTRYSDVFLLSQ